MAPIKSSRRSTTSRMHQIKKRKRRTKVMTMLRFKK